MRRCSFFSKKKTRVIWCHFVAHARPRQPGGPPKNLALYESQYQSASTNGGVARRGPSSCPLKTTPPGMPSRHIYTGPTSPSSWESNARAARHSATHTKKRRRATCGRPRGCDWRPTATTGGGSSRAMRIRSLWVDRHLLDPHCGGRKGRTSAFSRTK